MNDKEERMNESKSLNTSLLREKLLLRRKLILNLHQQIDLNEYFSRYLYKFNSISYDTIDVSCSI